MKRTILAPGHELLSYRIHEVTPLHQLDLFLPCLGLPASLCGYCQHPWLRFCRALWLTTFPEEERTKASKPCSSSRKPMNARPTGRTISIHCIFRLCQANADGDNLLIEGTTFPLLRQQTPQPDGGPFLCLSDFVRPSLQARPTSWAFASTISEGGRRDKTTLTNISLYRL